jgi:hypothetical protein
VHCNGEFWNELNTITRESFINARVNVELKPNCMYTHFPLQTTVPHHHEAKKSRDELQLKIWCLMQKMTTGNIFMSFGTSKKCRAYIYGHNIMFFTEVTMYNNWKTLILMTFLYYMTVHQSMYQKIVFSILCMYHKIVYVSENCMWHIILC